MSKRSKALARLAARPVDYTWSELQALLLSLSFKLEKAGGSGRKFVHAETHATLFIHEPHPGKILKRYQIQDAIDLLRKEKLL